MIKQDDLRTVVLDAMMEFYQEYIKPDTRAVIEDVVEEKLIEQLRPIKNALLTLNKNMSSTVTNHERRISSLETSHTA